MRVLGALLPAWLLVACGGSGGTQDASPARTPITRESLGRMPGRVVGDYGVHLLDADGQPADWGSTEIEADGPDTLSLTAESAPDDLYVYVTYPSEHLAFDAAELSPRIADNYLVLAVPRRIEGVLVVGLSRLRSRPPPTPAGSLMTLHFAPGREPSWRNASRVNSDPTSAPVLEVSAAATEATLTWTERNLGDYNNNGEVEIADITPVGIHFGELRSDSTDVEQFDCVDGDGNGEINLAELTPIGRNFRRMVEGYSVFRADGASPSDGDFVSLGDPTIERQPLFDSLQGAERLRRLRYSYVASLDPGPQTFYVQAWSADSGFSPYGTPSNRVTADGSAVNQAPLWVSTVGASAAVGQTSAVRITFGEAVDPEGGAVSYVLRYVPGGLAPGSPGTQSLTLPPEASAGIAPYTFVLTALTPGESYSINVQAQDEQGARTTNEAYLTAQVPKLDIDTEGWGFEGGGPGRSGALASCTVREPLETVWDVPADLPAPGLRTPLLEADGNVLAYAAGALARYSSFDGVDGGSWALPGISAIGNISEERLGWSGATHLGLVNLPVSGSTVDLDTTEPAAATMLFGSYLLGIGPAVKAWDTASGSDLWVFDPAADINSSAVSDGTSLWLTDTTGGVHKLDLATGEEVESTTVPASTSAIRLALDSANLSLFVASVTDPLVVLRSDDLSLRHEWPAGSPAVLALAIAGHATIPQLLTVSTSGSQWQLGGYRLSDWQQLWERPGALQPGALEVAAGSERIFLTNGQRLECLDYLGRLRQSCDLGSTIQAAPALDDDRVIIRTDAGLASLRTAVVDEVPQWQGTSAFPGGGIRAISNAPGEVTVEWDYATDDHSMPVFYAVYSREDGPPDFSPSHFQTSVQIGVPTTGTTHTVALTGLDDGARYYIGVQAYTGFWDDDPSVELNQNWLATTVCWQQETLTLGDELPVGEVFFMRGLTDPTGNMHLVYDDRVTAKATHVFGTTGSWTYESTGLSPYTTIGFEPQWNGAQDRLAIGFADSALLRLVERTAGDTWALTDFVGTIPVTNPQVSLDFGVESAIAYTQYMGGTFPVLDGEYWISRTVSGVWQPVEALDTVNFSGRDIDLELDPADDESPVVAFQRGFEYAPNRLTPQRGELWLARFDGSVYNLERVDVGENDDDADESNGALSDCGKRAQLVHDADGDPHIAYLDLNASAGGPLAQLKYASYDGTSWLIEVVEETDTAFQNGSLQYTWGELGLGLDQDGSPVIAQLARRTAPQGASEAHGARLVVYRRTTPGVWVWERLTDDVLVYPKDREPCVLAFTPDNLCHVFYATHGPQTDLADTIVHQWRQLPF